MTTALFLIAAAVNVFSFVLLARTIKVNNEVVGVLKEACKILDESTAKNESSSDQLLLAASLLDKAKVQRVEIIDNAKREARRL